MLLALALFKRKQDCLFILICKVWCNLPPFLSFWRCAWPLTKYSILCPIKDFPLFLVKESILFWAFNKSEEHEFHKFIIWIIWISYMAHLVGINFDLRMGVKLLWPASHSSAIHLFVYIDINRTFIHWPFIDFYSFRYKMGTHNSNSARSVWCFNP